MNSHGELLLYLESNKEATLDECAIKFPWIFKNHINRIKRKQLLDVGKEDFISHIKLLSKDDPELAKIKVLEIIKEVL